jgi:hypothetical protein
MGLFLGLQHQTPQPCNPFRYHDEWGKRYFISRNISAVNDVISKPFTLEELDATIQNLYPRIFEPALIQHAGV